LTERVLWVSGHRTDDPGRPRPRFPEDRVPQVRKRIAWELSQLDVGPSWTILTGGARGADLIAAEEALRLGARVELCLALEPEDFLNRSVRDGANGSVWEQSFAYVRDHATVEVLPGDAGDARGSQIFARANDWMIAKLAAAPEAHALLIWDGVVATGGGTGNAAQQALKTVQEKSGTFTIIDPTPRAYAARQRGPGPKKILTLTGGGLRGVISLEILAEIESQLRDTLGQPDLVLADYFDYLAGTSTGAIIATGLALGKSVDEIRTRYHQLGKLAFRRSLASVPYLSRFGASGITEQLEEFFGTDLTLGDPRLRTLLLLVLRHDDAGDPITIPTPHTRDSLAAQGVDVEIAGESADGAAARFAAHIIGWWLGYHPLSSDVLAETGYSVNLNRLPFPITQDGTVRPVRYGDLDGIPTTFAPIEHRHDFSDLDALPQMLTVEIDADGGAPPAPGLPHGTIKADPDDATRAVWFVHGSGVTRGVYDLRRPLYGDLDGIPATFAPSAHVHWQRVWYSDFLAANRSGKLVTTSGYECTATGASASGGTSGHLVNTGTPVQRLVLTVSVGTTNGMFAGAYLPSTAASTVNGARMHIVRSGGAWLFSGITYVAGVGGSPTPVNTTLTGTPSDGSTWTLVMETDGTGSVAVTVTPLGGVPQSFTVTVPSATVGGFSGQLNAGTGGLVLTQACFIKTPSA